MPTKGVLMSKYLIPFKSPIENILDFQMYLAYWTPKVKKKVSLFTGIQLFLVFAGYIAFFFERLKSRADCCYFIPLLNDTAPKTSFSFLNIQTKLPILIRDRAFLASFWKSGLLNFILNLSSAETHFLPEYF